MPLITYPNVPRSPGVPLVPRSLNFSAVPTVALGAIQGALWRALRVSNWGIYDSKGKALGDPAMFTGILNSVIESIGLGLSSTWSTDSVDYNKETSVSEFPVERGGFAAYNKVEHPATPTVRLCLQGTEAQRTTFLNAIDKATKSLDLYSVVTPEVKYLNYSVERYDYQRRANRGATLLIVSLMLKEVREVSAQFTITKQVNKPKESGATPQADTGKVQPKKLEQSTLDSVFDKLKGLAQ